ncbi:MAG: AAA family ATPase [Proteobacteria bacterium]|nr:AAA family ATPase [Pseudomonadota bacterium]
MYHQYFGLNEAPFSIAVNPRYLFMSTRHRDALAHLLYGVGSGGGFILLTGEVGTGKTTINRALLEQLPDATDVAIILNPALNALELLASVCDELGIQYDPQAPSLKTLTDQLHTFLLENHARGRNTVVMIDEAQHLDFEVLEQIRLLTNLETNNQKLLQIILIGQPELAQLLDRPELRQLNQRITARYNLEPLNLEETRAYIRHRLSVAGLAGDRVIFPDSVVRELFKRTRGIPRLINVLCDRILLGAYGQNKLQADRQMLQLAAKEVMGQKEEQKTWLRPILLLTILLLGLAGGAITGLLPVPGMDWLQTASSGEAVVQSKPEQSASKLPDRTAGEPGQLSVETSIQNKPPAWLLPPEKALSELWALASPNPLPEDICSGRIEQAGVSCVTEAAQTWGDLEQFDRPLILDMITAQRFSASVLLLGIRGRSAMVLGVNGIVETDLADLGPAWSGSYRFLWRPPGGFVGPLSIGDTSPVVAEVAVLFSQLDGQAETLTANDFNAALQQRVILFQRQYGLADDGVVGRQTLLKLNELLGIDAGNTVALEQLQNKFREAGLQ